MPPPTSPSISPPLSSSPPLPTPTPTQPIPDHNQHVPDPISHFQSIPWCAGLLSDPSIQILVPDRRPLASGESSFVRRTMNSGTTVRACVSWFRPLTTTTPKAERNGDKSERLLRGDGEAKANGEDPHNPFLVFSALLDLGEDLNSYAGTMHGGLYGVLMDEVMGTAANFQSPHGAYTVRFQTDFRRQVRTPQVVLVRGRVTRRDGRKLHVRGAIEDKDGNIMAEGSGLWLSMGKNVGRSQL